MNTKPLVVSIPFSKAREYLNTHSRIDGTPAGGAPITMRWLNSKNKYVNLGLDELVGKTVVLADQNSYEIAQSDLEELAAELNTHFKVGAPDAAVQNREDHPERPHDSITGTTNQLSIALDGPGTPDK